MIHYLPQLKHWQCNFTINLININSEVTLTQAAATLTPEVTVHYVPALQHWPSTFTIESIGINFKATSTQATAALILAAATIYYVPALKQP